MTQQQKIIALLSDGQPHSNFEIVEKTRMYRYAARILELKKKGYVFKVGHDRENHQMYWYQLVTTPVAAHGGTPPEAQRVQRELV